MYAAELIDGSDPETSRLVDDYMSVAELLMSEVFGYSDTGVEVPDLLTSLEVAFREIPPAVRSHADLDSHYGFVRTLGLKSQLVEGSA